jgi:hypothetical protein
MGLISRSLTRRAVAFALICVVSLGGAIAYSLLRRGSGAAELPGISVEVDPAAVSSLAARSHILFRSTALGPGYGHLSLVALDDLNGARVPTSLRCERLHYVAGTGVCLAAKRGVITSYRADLFDDSFEVRRTLPLAGIPSRARIAPDGSLVAHTSFVSGDSYAAAGFSTRTLLVEAVTGRSLGDLEEFAVWRGDTRFQSVDFNFWGVTFAARQGVFYATLGTGGKTYLVEGDGSSRTMRLVREDVECPALSPDNRRIAFKRRQPGIGVTWRIHVLDLASGDERPVTETRSVDDQVEWLDDATIIYALPRESQAASASMDVWQVPAAGGGIPQVLLKDAESPSIVRR